MGFKFIIYQIFFIVVVSFSYSVFSQNEATLDVSFDNDGFVSIPYDGINSIYPSFVEVLNDNSYLVGVNTRHNNTKQCFLTKFYNDGTIDTNFGNNGRLIFESIFTQDGTYTSNYISSIHKLDNDDFLVFGMFEDTYQVFKIDSNGNFLTQFGNQGFKSLSEGSWGMSHTVLSDDKILTSYVKRIDSINEFKYGFSKYSNDIELDTSFANNGNKILNITSQTIDRVSKVLNYSDSTFITVGNSMPSMTFDQGVVARFTYDGNLDPSFGTNGVIELNYNVLGVYTTLNDITIQQDNKILVCGRSLYNGGTGGQNYYASMPIIIRYNADGSLDSSFDNGGIKIVSNTLFDANDNYTRIKVLPDNKILVLGYASLPFPYMKTAVLLRRFHPDGSPDLSFGDDSYFFYFKTPNTTEDEGNGALGLEILENNKLLFLSFNEDNNSYTEGRMYRLHINTLSNTQFNVSDIKYFPNPVDNVLNLESSFDISELSIYDLKGKLVMERNDFLKSSIDVSKLSSGIYVVKLKDNFLKSHSFKIIKN